MTRPASAVEDYPLRSLFFGLLTGPIVWSLFFMAGYGLTEFACKMGVMQARVLGLTVVTLTIVVLGVIALSITVFAGIFAYRHWDRLDEAELGYHTDQELLRSTKEFLALAGILLNILFAVLIILTAIPSLMLAPC